MTAPLKVYVAASSAEIERAKHCSELIRSRGDGGIAVVSTWIENIERVGVANPRDAATIDRALWAATCADQVKGADLFWLLTPIDTPGRGSYFELGVALTCSMLMFEHTGVHRWAISSGDTKQSIFTALTREFEHDFDAAAFIIKLAKERLRG